MNHFRTLDVAVIAVHFTAVTVIGLVMARRANSTERYFVGGRSYPGWLIGISMFGAVISSISFVAYPADAFRTGYLRYVICLSLPLAVLIASRLFIPFFRRGKVTSVFEYLEKRFGPRVRVYGASVFIVSQCFRISLIQFLVALLVNRVTGWDVVVCILIGGTVTAFYTIAGGIEAVIWTDFLESMLLVSGALLILGVILWKLPGGMAQLLDVAQADGKFMLSEVAADGSLEPVPWGFSLRRKTVFMLLFVGLFQWLGEYSYNQEIIQKYCAARSARDARRAMWINCAMCLPAWGYFMFLGTALYAFYHVNPDPVATAILSGERKAEEIIPYFVTTQLPPGAAGLVVAGILAAAMSSMGAAMNSISAVAVTDLYKRHLAPDREDRHYMGVARMVTLAASLVMMGGAFLLFRADTLTLQDLWSEFQSIIAGGLLGLYMLGFFTIRGDGRAVGVGILFAVVFSAIMSASGLGWLPFGMSQTIRGAFDGYYTGIVGNLVMFTLGFILARTLPGRKRDLTNITVWTQDAQPLD